MHKVFIFINIVHYVLIIFIFIFVLFKIINFIIISFIHHFRYFEYFNFILSYYRIPFHNINISKSKDDLMLLLR